MPTKRKETIVMMTAIRVRKTRRIKARRIKRRRRTKIQRGKKGPIQIQTRQGKAAIRAEIRSARSLHLSQEEEKIEMRIQRRESHHLRQSLGPREVETRIASDENLSLAAGEGGEDNVANRFSNTSARMHIWCELRLML